MMNLYRIVCVAAACLLVVVGCAPTPLPESSPLLYVWAGDEDMRAGDTDFLAVVDADPSSETYGNILASAPVQAVGTNPHHAEPVAPRDALLFANGFDSGRTFLFDLSDPTAPRAVAELDSIPGLTYPHSFLRLEDGRLLATMQYGVGEEAGRPGGLALFDREGTLLATSSAADPAFYGALIRPYSVEALPAQDRLVTTSRTMNMTQEVAADLVQVWRLSDLALLKTLEVPRVEPAEEPECVLGQQPICSATQYPAEAQPFEARAMPDGSVLMNTLMCGFYRIHGLDTGEPRIEAVLNYPDMIGCSVPAVIGHYYILPAIFGETILVFDMSDPEHVREAGRFDTPGYQPHWAAADPLRDRVVITSSGPAAVNTVLMLDFDRQTGTLSLDEGFGSPTFPRAGVSFYRDSWPHGDTGSAKPHAALFGSK